MLYVGSVTGRGHKEPDSRKKTETSGVTTVLASELPYSLITGYPRRELVYDCLHPYFNGGQGSGSLPSQTEYTRGA